MKEDKDGWWGDNIEVVNVNGNKAEVMIPIIKTLRIYKDKKGMYVIIKGMKVYSRYLE